MLYLLTVDWERLIIGLEVSLALFVALRVLVLRLTSVRRTAFSRLPGLRRLFRKVWNIALTIGIVPAIWEAQYSPTLLMLSTAFEIDRAISTLVGFALVSVIGFVFWYRVRITENVQMVSIGAAATFSVRIIIVFTGTLEKAGFRWPFEIGTIVWIACLAYWLLFLSRRGEVVDSEIAQI
jgi:hypothetical protein